MTRCARLDTHQRSPAERTRRAAIDDGEIERIRGVRLRSESAVERLAIGIRSVEQVEPQRILRRSAGCGEEGFTVPEGIERNQIDVGPLQRHAAGERRLGSVDLGADWQPVNVLVRVIHSSARSGVAKNPISRSRKPKLWQVVSRPIRMMSRQCGRGCRPRR